MKTINNIVKKLLSLIVIMLLSLTMINASSLDSIDVGFKTHHLKQLKDYKYNENNLSIGLNFDNGFNIGYINKNSYRNKSIWLGYDFNKIVYKDIEISNRVSLLTGYKGYSADGYYMKTNSIVDKFGGLLPNFSTTLKYKNIKTTVLINPSNIKNSVLYFGLTIYKF